jgi:ABC-2 type transport system permease protein
LVVLTSLCSAFAIAGIGTVIAAATYKADNDKMANVFETAVIQTMALLGGSFFPIDIMPSFMRKFSILSLNGISLKSYLSVMRGYGIREIAEYLILLVTLGAVFAILAVYIFNRKGGDKFVKYNQTKTVKAA